MTDQSRCRRMATTFHRACRRLAALAGLVFVAMSLHPQPILVNTLTRARAFVAAFGYLIGVSLALITLLPARTAPVGSLLLIGLGVGGTVLVIYRDSGSDMQARAIARVIIGDLLLLTPIVAGTVGVLQPQSEAPFLLMAIAVGAGLFVLFSQSWALVLHGVKHRVDRQPVMLPGSSTPPPSTAHEGKAIADAAPV